jgi:hypothetical protein
MINRLISTIVTRVILSRIYRNNKKTKLNITKKKMKNEEKRLSQFVRTRSTADFDCVVLVTYMRLCYYE